MRKSKFLLAAVLLAGLSFSLSASPITGTFDIAGTITVTPTTITWVLNSAPFTPNQATIGPGSTGDFAPLAGTTVTIEDLNSATEPVNVSFPAQKFITFNAAPSFPTLDINFIYAGLYSSTNCFAAPAVGQTCTTTGSPFSFVNNPPGPPKGPQATAGWVFSGVTSDGLEAWQGNFTSQFSVPFQQVLLDLGTSGSVTNTFSATFTLAPVSQVPETGTLYLLGAGLIGLSLKLRRRTS
jgi:hypothetical protein